jgi:hypothetical protein
VRILKGSLIRSGLLAGLLGIAFYTLRAETEIPDFVLDSVKLLKKPVEDLLPDLKDASEEATTADAVQQATLDLEPYVAMQNNRERWNEMRSLIESGQPLQNPLPSEIAVSTSVAGRMAPDVPPPPGFTVQLPYQSRLTVSGRKTIGMTYKATRYSNAGYATTQGLATGQSNFELQQQLQVRINGQVGRKVTVNVDFDDTKEDKKDISIVYKGDPDEIVQRAAFGDINLSLPATEFAGYSKQVFGASAELKYKALHAYLIGSRTKGESETKEFVGNVILQRLDIADTSFVRRRFYRYTNLTAASANDRPAINTINVYLDTQDVTRSSATFSPTVKQVDLSLLIPSATTYTGNFVRLSPGVDYTVDPSTGLITFRNTLAPNAVVAIEYPDIIRRGSFPDIPKVLKADETRVIPPLTGPITYTTPGVNQTEDLTHYTIGTTKIVRDNGQGNFILRVLDLGRNDVGQNLGIQYLPNNLGQIIMDFEQGTFSLNKNFPNNVYPPESNHQYTFFVEFRSRVKTYTLRPNIVLNSERILLNGRQLTRDVDYFIDYESGFITFFNEDQITEDSRLVATYDFSPFGIAGAQQDTLVGERIELGLYPLHPILGQSLIGSTVLYDFAPKQTAAPDIRQTSGSFLLTEGDIHFKDIIFNPLPFLKTSLAGEVARSVRNPNTFGKALIDNMEGIKDDTSIGLSKLNWLIAANPPGESTTTFANAIGIVTNEENTGNLRNQRIPTLDINPSASALRGDQTQVLDINYDLTASTAASIATVLSPTGIDLSKKLYLEMWVKGDGSADTASPTGTQIGVTLGQISEDMDYTGGGGFSDINGAHSIGDGTPRTEDANRNNTLDLGEDAGIIYRNPDGTEVRIGASNLRIDTEDLDRNGILDAENSQIGGSFGYNATQAIDFGGGAGANRVDFTGWRFVRVPLNISSSTAGGLAAWTAVKELRLTLRQGAGGGRAGLIQIAKIAIVGNRWLVDDTSVTGSTMTVQAVNNEDDTAYFSPSGSDFDALNQVNTALSGPQPTKRREQALSMVYNVPAPISGTSTATIRSVTISPMDFSIYDSLKFFVRRADRPAGSNLRGNFIFRAGSDTDFWQYSIPVDQIPSGTEWKLITVRQRAPGKEQRASEWIKTAEDEQIRAEVIKVGQPNLTSVSQLRFGIENPQGGVGDNAINEIWINELHADGALSRTGIASRIGAAFEWMGWGKLDLAMRELDRNFETFTSAITNQDRNEQTATFDLTRMQYFPMRFTALRRRTTTPNVQTIANSTLVSVLQEGRVEEKAMSGQGTLQFPSLPKIGLNWDTNKIDTRALYRTDKTDRYGATLDYTLPGTRRILPKTVQLGYKITDFRLKFGPQALVTTNDLFSVSDTQDKTTDLSARLSFQPLTGFTFNPNFSRTITREFKDIDPSTGTLTDEQRASLRDGYDKLKAQTLGLDGVLSFTRWFAPRVRYSVTNRETYGIPIVSSPTANLQKSVDRTATGETAWDFAWRDFSRKGAALQSLNIVSSYLIEDGDTYDTVPGGTNSLWSLSLRKRLNAGERRNLTLRDTFRSTQRWSPFDWATHWKGAAIPLRTLSLTSTFTDTKQKTETTGTPSRILTKIYPDFIFSLTQTEHLFRLQNLMSNSQMNIKTQYKSVDTVGTSYQKSSSNGGDWRFTLWRKLDLFVTYTRTTDNTFDRINNVVSNDATGETLGTQLGFNVGKWRFTPKYDQTKQKAVDSSGRLTTDLTTRTPAVQAYADLYLPAGLRLPFGDLMVFSNRIRTTSTISLTQRRSSLNENRDNTDTYTFTTSEDYEMTSNVRLTVGGSYAYTRNKVTPDANFYSYEFNSLLTIQF